MTCDQATFMLERRWDKTLGDHEECVLDEHILGCAACNSEALAIAAADRVFLQIPDCAPPLGIAAAVALRIADETPVEPNRVWFWGAIAVAALLAAVVWYFGMPVPNAVFASPYCASLRNIIATVSGAMGQWLGPLIPVVRSLSPLAPVVLPVVGVAACIETVMLGRWLVRQTGRGQLPGRV